MKRIKKGWEVFKLSFDIAQKMKSLWALILASIFTEFIFVIITGLLIFFINFDSFTKENLDLFMDKVQNLPKWEIYSFSFLMTYISIFIATFYNFAISFSILEFLNKNKKVSFGEAISFSSSRISDITIWTMVLVTVNIIFSILNSLAEKLGKIGEIIMRIINGFLGAAWNLMTLFVIPNYVENEGKNVKDVLMESKNMFVKTWGESVVASVSVGFFTVVFTSGIIIILVMVTLFSFTINPVFGISILALSFLIIIFVIVFNSAMDRIFKILLYLYAKNNSLPEWISNQDVIKEAYSKK